jgi:hypothetical protein
VRGRFPFPARAGDRVEALTGETIKARAPVLSASFGASHGGVRGLKGLAGESNHLLIDSVGMLALALQVENLVLNNSRKVIKCLDVPPEDVSPEDRQKWHIKTPTHCSG